MNGLITRESPHGVAATLQRLSDALDARDITIFSVVDHAEGAARAGLELRPTTVVIFGNPKAGTPMMQASQTAGIDLPLKMLVWQDSVGKTQLSYNDPAWVASRHGIKAEKAVSALSAVLAALADEAASVR